MSPFEAAEPLVFHPNKSYDAINSLLDGKGEDAPLEKYIYSLGEIMTMEIPEHRNLWGKFLPLTGLSAIVGPPDSGKSMFGRGLVVSIATGQTEFAGYTLSPRYGKALYVSTEDGLDANMYCFRKQAPTLHVDPSILQTNENLKIIFTDQIDSETLLKDLATLLSENPVDLIVLDSYSDLFTGKDSNSNSETRNFLRAFNRLASRFECLILFIHHINKSGYNDSPQQRHVQGASAFSQKLRLILDLRPKDVGSNLRYLSVVKGNGIPSALKKNAIEYDFSEDNFTFTKTGNEKPISDFIFVPKKPIMEELDYSLLFEVDEKEQHYSILVENYVKLFKKSISSAKRDIPKFLHKNENGLYDNPKYQGITVSNSIQNDTMIPDTNEQSETISEEMQDEFAFDKTNTSENLII